MDEISGGDKAKTERRTVRFFEALLRTSIHGILITDAVQNVIVVNDAFCALLERRRQDVIGTNVSAWLERCDAGAQGRWSELEQRVRQEGACRNVTFQIRCPAADRRERAEGVPENGVRYLSVDASLAEGAAGEKTHTIVSIWRDVTKQIQVERALQHTRDELEDRRMVQTTELAEANEQLRQEIARRERVEETLRESEQKFRSIVEGSHDGVVLVDEEGTIVEWSRGQEQITGLDQSQVVGQRLWDMLPRLLPKDTWAATMYQEYESDVLEFLKVGHSPRSDQLIEYEVQHPDGTRRMVQQSLFPIRTDRGFMAGAIVRDITERVRMEGEIRQRNRDLELLNRAGRVFNSTLNMDQVLITVLEETRQMLDVVACSAWLIDPATDELVCRQSAGPRSETVRGWRLASGQGIAGWAVHSGEGLIVSDVRSDDRFYTGVEERTKVGLRSLLAVPLLVKGNIIGALEVLDARVNHFGPADLELVEALASIAAAAIENARLFEQARQDAEARALLLREVNHRVKNNLTGIIGLLYAARRHARIEGQAAYQSAMDELIGRVRGLAAVHDMLSASRWAPLRLTDLAATIIGATLHALPRERHISVDVSPSPVRVTSDQAHNLALVINELATNTAKYALGERDKAQIAFRVSLEHGDGARTVCCEFRDDGPGYPEDILRLERHKMGFDLIQAVVRKNLRGELVLRNDRGAVAHVRFQVEA